MSGQCTGWVLRHGPLDRAMRSVLLVIADAANRDGEHAYPGMAALTEGSLYGERTVQETIKKLLAGHWISVEKPGGGRGRQTVYKVRMEIPATTAGFVTAKPRGNPAETPRFSDAKPRETADPHYLFTNGLKDNENVNARDPEPLELQAPPATKPTRHATPLPDQFFVTDAMRDWLHLNQLEHLDWRTEAAQFADHHRARGSTMKDWTAAWRTWMRNAGKWQPKPALLGQAKPGYAVPMSKKDQLLQHQMAVVAQAREAARANGRH